MMTEPSRQLVLHHTSAEVLLRRAASLALLCLCFFFSAEQQCDAFIIIRQPHSVTPGRHPSRHCTSSQLSATNAATTTLTKETTWQLRLILKNVSTQSGKKVDEIFAIRGYFDEEEGYEPPQGTFVPILKDDNEGEESDDKKPILKINKARWKLSEDPDDRKDGLWIWGLFSEPLYPYLLLQVETEQIELVDAEIIPPLVLYAQINHRRDRDNDGAVTLESAELQLRNLETLKADPFGAAKVDIYDDVNIGNLSIQPIL